MLPFPILAAHSFFSLFLVVRNSVRIVRNETCVLMAKIRGIPERTVNRSYVLVTATPPVVTLLGFRLPYSAGGAIMAEVVFSSPGIGRLTYEAVMNHDYPLLQGAFPVFTLWVLLVNFCTDCLHLKLDPRLKEA